MVTGGGVQSYSLQPSEPERAGHSLCRGAYKCVGVLLTTGLIWAVGTSCGDRAWAPPTAKGLPVWLASLYRERLRNIFKRHVQQTGPMCDFSSPGVGS